MMKKCLFLLLAFLTGALTLLAQTARKFTIDLTDDGKAQMLAFLPEKPSGRAIVGIPGGGYSVLSNSHEGKKSKNAQPVRPKIYLCTPIPAFKSSWNINDAVITNEIIPIQKEVAQQYGLQLIDLHTLFANDGDKMQEDGIHPDGKGVRRIADIVAEALKK